jgi:hypothetical protein
MVSSFFLEISFYLIKLLMVQVVIYIIESSVIACPALYKGGGGGIYSDQIQYVLHHILMIHVEEKVTLYLAEISPTPKLINYFHSSLMK